MRPNGDMPPPMRTATAETPGRRGLVPMPPAGSQTKFLRGDGTFQAISGGGDMLAANNLGDVARPATARTNLGVYSQAEVDAQRNALAPAQALSGNGTAGSTIANTQAFGTGDFTIAGTFNAANLSSVQALTGGNANPRPIVLVGTNGALYLNTGTTTTATTAAGAVVAGTTYSFAVVRASGITTIYLNGVAQGSGADSTNYTNALAALGQAANVGGNLLTGTLRLLGIANRAMSAAEVLSLYQTGSWPAADFNSASNTATYTSDFSAGVDSWGVAAGAATVSGNTDGVGGLDNWLKYTATAANALGIYRNTNLVAAAGKRYRYTFTIRHNSSTVTSIKVYEYGNTTNGVTGIAVAPNTNVSVTVDLPNPAAAATYLIVQTEQAPAIGDLIYLRAFTSYNLGLLVAPDPAQPGNGLTWGDRSGNGAHILLPASGVDWLLPSAAVNKLRGTTSTSGNQQLLGGTTLNANTQITRVRARSRSGTPSITLGTAIGESQIVASVALSTTWKDLTIALTGGIISTASSVWVGSSTADVVEIDLTHEPLGY